MKKKLISVKDFADKMDAIKRKVKNAFSEEGAEAAAAIRDLIDELENAEIEIDERELASRVEEVIRAYNGRADEEVPANVANALAKKFAEMQKTMPVSDQLTPAIKNQVAAAIRDLIDELENAEIEIDERELASRIEEVIRAYNGRADEEVPANVANALAKKFAEMQKTMPVSDKLTPAIKNQVAAAILRCSGKEAVANAVNAVLVKNGISGLSFNDTIDFAINDTWGDSDELFAALKKVNFSKFFYTAQDFNDANVAAHGWSKDSESEKAIQQLTVNGKTISTQYIYKRQQIAFEDLDDIEESGNTATFLRWLDKELDRQIVNAIIAVMLGRISTFSDITTIESLYGNGATDAFRTKVIVADQGVITFSEARDIADAVRTGIGAKWMVMSQSQLTALAKFKYASGGDDIFRSKDEVAAMLGVDRIYVTDKTAHMFCFVPSEYWVKEKASLQVSYPKYENNVMNYQRERNIGGAIHGLKSVAFGAEA